MLLITCYTYLLVGLCSLEQEPALEAFNQCALLLNVGLEDSFIPISLGFIKLIFK